MASETLITFLLYASSIPKNDVETDLYSESVPRSHCVELYGSWDNFHRPYPMRKDTQKGHGHWLGCHTFKNIICDGDPAHPAANREGGLMEGGTYWYYVSQR